jgi:hypothetical protein
MQAGDGKQVRNSLFWNTRRRIRFDILSSFDIVDLTFKIEGFVYEHF